MITATSCSWCHEPNAAAQAHCHACGHEAHTSRMDCRCGRCRMFFGGIEGHGASKYGPPEGGGEEEG